MTDPLEVPYRERERSVTIERLDRPDEPLYGTELEPETELFTVNIGPHHPATHGVLRLLTTLEGEVVREVKPLIGYVHTGIEKSCEDQQYWKAITFVERMDYLAYYFNACAYCMSVEKLLDDHCVPDPADEVVSGERMDAMRRSMAEMLSGLEVDVLRLYVEGKSYQEIGNQLGRHVKSIDNALQRVKRKLERNLEGEED